jgi:hypothetical protein
VRAATSNCPEHKDIQVALTKSAEDPENDDEDWASSHAAEILAVEDPDLGYDAATFPY